MMRSQPERIRRPWMYSLALGFAAMAGGIGAPAASGGRARAPEFTHSDPAAWLNSEPLTLARLRGRVVLIDFWTSDCWNCYRSFPWLRALERRFAGRDLTIIGVHSPEFERERDVARVAAKVREYGLQHPIMIDDDLSYWRAIGNRYWPAWYLVDRAGYVRDLFVGETHIGDAQAAKIREAIDALLAER